MHVASVSYKKNLRAQANASLRQGSTDDLTNMDPRPMKLGVLCFGFLIAKDELLCI